MSQKKLLVNLINALEKHEFDKVVKIYLKEIHDFKRIVNTDGKDDVGLDIKIFSLNGIKIQFQLTTQKSATKQEKYQFDKKIKEDLTKAKLNHDKYDYSDKLIFFYSKSLTNKVIRENERLAFTEYGINLELIDANRIAEESDDYIEIQRAIYKLNDIDGSGKHDGIFNDKNKNLVMDLIGFGKSSEIRKQIVESYILHLLFENKKMDKSKIIGSCVSKFNAKDNLVFYEKLFAQLTTQRRIIKSKDKHNYILHSDEESRINNLFQKYDLEEEVFLKNIQEILSFYNMDGELESFIQQLKIIYTENFNSDIFDVIIKSESSDLTSLSRDFKKFIENKLGDKEQTTSLAIKLLSFCQDNKFIQKYCAGKVFSETTNSDSLERYVNTQKRIFVDTQIALYVLCYFYKPKCDNKNYFFQISKSLIEYNKANDISLNIFENYIWEIGNHIQEAISLIPFTSLPSFQKLGSSRNVFYNFYLFLDSNCLNNSKSFAEFLNDFGFNQSINSKSLESKIEYYLENVGIKKYKIEKRYDITNTQEIIQNELIASNKFKTKFSLNNDAIMTEFLSDNDVTIHPLQPIFTTWDKTFFKIRVKYFKDYPNSQRWFLFTPSKLIDHYAMLDFSIDSETVSREMLALISDEIVVNTHSLLDAVTWILNPNEEIGLEYTNKLAEIRDNEIHQIKQNQVVVPDEVEGEAVIDDVFYKLTSYYNEPEKDIDELKIVFTKREFFDEVIEILLREVENFYETKHISEALFSDFDKLIWKIKDDKQKRITSGNS